jgi:hypothetical protein
LSVGIESAEDLARDLTNALDCVVAEFGSCIALEEAVV